MANKSSISQGKCDIARNIVIAIFNNNIAYRIFSQYRAALLTAYKYKAIKLFPAESVLHFTVEVVTPHIYIPPKTVKSNVWNYYGFERRDQLVDERPISRACRKKVAAPRANTNNLHAHLRDNHPALSAKLKPKKMPNVSNITCGMRCVKCVKVWIHLNNVFVSTLLTLG